MAVPFVAFLLSFFFVVIIVIGLLALRDMLLFFQM